jgi:hypothetical protein
MRFAVITLPPQASLGLVLHWARSLVPAENVPPPHDPVFLPDFAALTPDQVQELHYGWRLP